MSRADTRDLLAPPHRAGWRMAGSGGFRAVCDGVVESQGGPGLFWYAAEAFDDFVLTIEWRLTDLEDNSGVFLRCPALADSPQPAIDQGYEVQIDDRGIDPQARTSGSPHHLTGAIYRLAPAIRRCSAPPGQWNTFEIHAAGAMIAVRLNGSEVSRLDPALRRRRGHIGLQNHHSGSKVQFRRALIRPAAPNGRAD